MLSKVINVTLIEYYVNFFIFLEIILLINNSGKMNIIIVQGRPLICFELSGKDNVLTQ